VRGRGLTRSKERSLGTWEGRGPLFNRRGRHARNLLGGRRLPSFVLALAAHARARGSLRVGGGERGDIVWVEVAGREGVEVVPPLPVLAGLVQVGEQLGVLLGVTESLAKSCIVEGYEVFRVFSRSLGRGGGCSGHFLDLLRGRGAGVLLRWGGPACGGRCMGWGRDWG